MIASTKIRKQDGRALIVMPGALLLIAIGVGNILMANGALIEITGTLNHIRLTRSASIRDPGTELLLELVEYPHTFWTYGANEALVSQFAGGELVTLHVRANTLHRTGGRVQAFGLQVGPLVVRKQWVDLARSVAMGGLFPIALGMICVFALIRHRYLKKRKYSGFL